MPSVLREVAQKYLFLYGWHTDTLPPPAPDRNESCSFCALVGGTFHVEGEDTCFALLRGALYGAQCGVAVVPRRVLPVGLQRGGAEVLGIVGLALRNTHPGWARTSW